MEWMMSQAGAVLAGVGAGAALLVAARFVPRMISKHFGSMLDRAMGNVAAIEDEGHRKFAEELAALLVRWAEYSIPDAKSGREKYAAVAEKIAEIVPGLKGKNARIQQMIESSVIRMKEELSRR